MLLCLDIQTTTHEPCGINKRADTNSGFHIKGANHLKSLQLSVIQAS